MLTYSEYQLSSILYVLLCYELWRTHQLTSPPNIDVPGTCAGNDVDHCDTDIHFSDGLLLFRGNVRRHFFTFFITLNAVDILVAWWTRTSKRVVATSRIKSRMSRSSECPSRT